MAFACIIKSDDGAAMLHALQNDARVYKVSHYKKWPWLVFQDTVEHEFVIVHLRYGCEDLIFCLDRSVGPKKDGLNAKDTPKNSPELIMALSNPIQLSSDSPSSSRAYSVAPRVILHTGWLWIKSLPCITYLQSTFGQFFGSVILTGYEMFTTLE